MLNVIHLQYNKHLPDTVCQHETLIIIYTAIQHNYVNIQLHYVAYYN